MLLQGSVGNWHDAFTIQRAPQSKGQHQLARRQWRLVFQHVFVSVLEEVMGALSATNWAIPTRGAAASQRRQHRFFQMVEVGLQSGDDHHCVSFIAAVCLQCDEVAPQWASAFHTNFC